MADRVVFELAVLSAKFALPAGRQVYACKKDKLVRSERMQTWHLTSKVQADPQLRHAIMREKLIEMAELCEDAAWCDEFKPAVDGLQKTAKRLIEEGVIEKSELTNHSVIFNAI